jgi:hypothetical protein
MSRAVFAIAGGEKKLTGTHENGPSSHDSEQGLHREKEGSKGISLRVKYKGENESEMADGPGVRQTRPAGVRHQLATEWM